MLKITVIVWDFSGLVFIADEGEATAQFQYAGHYEQPEIIFLERGKGLGCHRDDAHDGGDSEKEH